MTLFPLNPQQQAAAGGGGQPYYYHKRVFAGNRTALTAYPAGTSGVLSFLGGGATVGWVDLTLKLPWTELAGAWLLSQLYSTSEIWIWNVGFCPHPTTPDSWWGCIMNDKRDHVPIVAPGPAWTSPLPMGNGLVHPYETLHLEGHGSGLIGAAWAQMECTQQLRSAMLQVHDFYPANGRAILHASTNAGADVTAVAQLIVATYSATSDVWL